MQQSIPYIPLAPKAKGRVICGAGLLWLYQVMFTFSMSVVLPPIMAGYDMMAYYAILGGIVALSGCIVTPIGGKLGDRFGRRRVYLWVGYLRVVLILFCAIPTSGPVFFGAYTLACLAGGLLNTYSTTILSDVTTLEERPRWFGVFGTINGLGLLTGMLGGGIVADLLGPLHIFWIIAPVGLASLVLLTKYYPNRPAEERVSIDSQGMALMGLGLAMVLGWCSFGGVLFPRLSPVGIGLLAVGGLMLALFFRHECRADDPVLKFALLRNRNFAMSCGMYIAVAPMVQLCATGITLFGQVSLGMSATASGTLAMPKNILLFLLPSVMGVWLGKNTGRFRIVFLACGTSIALGGLFAATWSSATPLILIYLGMLLFGVGTSCQSVSVQPYMQLTVPPSEMGGAMGMLQFASSLSGMVYSVVYNLLYNARYSAAMAAGGGEHLARAVTEVFSSLSLITAAFGGLVVVLTLWLVPRGQGGPESRERQQ